MFTSFHATVMPCFDKKLEASREDFAMDDLGENVREVDCVLTTGEVAEMIAVAAGLGAPSSGGGDGAGATLDSGELGKGELAAKGAAALAPAFLANATSEAAVGEKNDAVERKTGNQDRKCCRSW